MVDVMAAFASLQQAASIAKTLVGINEAVAVNSKAIELQQIIIDAQGKILGSREEILKMAQEIADLKKLVAEREDLAARYEKVTPYESTRVYKLKDDDAARQGFFCPCCFEHKKQAITLQGGPVTLVCPVCHGTYDIAPDNTNYDSLYRAIPSGGY